jgi:hypothetical protein
MLWKAYDPFILPAITSALSHDSSGVNGHPANVILCERPAMDIINAGVSQRTRYKIWPGTYDSGGRIYKDHKHRGEPAYAKRGEVVITDFGDYSYTFSGYLTS